ncbi:hypothetical protein PENTCL1PPCAC_20207, partial [Pristionchus entomophagus]
NKTGDISLESLADEIAHPNVNVYDFNPEEMLDATIANESAAESQGDDGRDPEFLDMLTRRPLKDPKEQKKRAPKNVDEGEFETARDQKEQLESLMGYIKERAAKFATYMSVVIANNQATDFAKDNTHQFADTERHHQILRLAIKKLAESKKQEESSRGSQDVEKIHREAKAIQEQPVLDHLKSQNPFSRVMGRFVKSAPEEIGIRQAAIFKMTTSEKAIDRSAVGKV